MTSLQVIKRPDRLNVTTFTKKQGAIKRFVNYLF